MNIDQIKTRHEAATEGPWDDQTTYYDGPSVNYSLDAEHDVFIVASKTSGDIALINNTYPEERQRANSQFIAHARQDIPDLTTEIERLRELVKTAYREGGQVGYGDDPFDQDNYCWDNSEARIALEQ